MIFAKKCPQCATMRQTINSMIKHLELDAQLYAYNCEEDESIDIALDNDISDVPGCNINGTIIEGDNYDHDKLVETLKKLAE